MNVPAHCPLTQDEVRTMADKDRHFTGFLFGPMLCLDDFDLSEARFERCLFSLELVRAVDLSGGTFKDCRFGPARFASCKLAEVHFENCSLFDVAQKKGCTFAFCDLAAAQMTKCNFATSSFERCDLYDLRAVECSFRGCAVRPFDL